jgi:hypothetical protein
LFIGDDEGVRLAGGLQSQDGNEPGRVRRSAAVGGTDFNQVRSPIQGRKNVERVDLVEIISFAHRRGVDEG